MKSKDSEGAIDAALGKLGSLVGNRFEIVVVASSVALGTIFAIVAMSTAAQPVPAGFYNTIAQILPVFLVALAVEQKLVDRLGMNEDEYVARANQSLGIAVEALWKHESQEYSRARELQESFDSRPQFAWVDAHTSDFLYVGDPSQEADISAEARARYQRLRTNEIVFVLATVLLLIVGEMAALGGMLQGGTPSSCSPYLGLSIGATVAVVLALSSSVGRELIASLRRSA